MIIQDTDLILTARDVRKSFGRVEALRGADFDVRRGEVVALMGDNGAGKSTLVKVLSGVIIPDAGTITLDGKPLTVETPEQAREAGIETVYQDLALAGHVGLGGEPVPRSGVAALGAAGADGASWTAGRCAARPRTSSPTCR